MDKWCGTSQRLSAGRRDKSGVGKVGIALASGKSGVGKVHFTAFVHELDSMLL